MSKEFWEIPEETKKESLDIDWLKVGFLWLVFGQITAAAWLIATEIAGEVEKSEEVKAFEWREANIYEEWEE